MAKILRNDWKETMRDKIKERYSTHFNVVLSENIAIKWVIVELSSRDIPFKIFNLGAGVKRITTDTEVCPCCKRKL